MEWMYLALTLLAAMLAMVANALPLYREAEPPIARSLAIHKQALGPEHPYMAYSLSNQADNFFLQGDYSQAESYYKKALAIRERNLGVEHPRTVSTYYNLAQLH